MPNATLHCMVRTQSDTRDTASASVCLRCASTRTHSASPATSKRTRERSPDLPRPELSLSPIHVSPRPAVELFPVMGQQLTTLPANADSSDQTTNPVSVA